MIRINLLPSRRARRTMTLRVGFQSTGIFVVGVVVLVLLIEGLSWYWLQTRLRDLRQEKLTAERELVVLKKKVKEVENYEKDKRVYEDRIAVIQKLKKNQQGPVRILDRISFELPDQVWLTSLTQAGEGITLDGMAMTNAALVKYVNNLKQSLLFTDVQLLESRQTTDFNMAVYKFQITFKVNLEMI